MDYVVHVVGDDELPAGRHVVIVERDDAPAVMLINGVPARVWELMRQWEDTCEPCTLPSVLLAPPLRLVV